MTTTTLTSPKHKSKVRIEPTTYGADNPTFMRLYCSAFTGLLSQPLTYFHPDYGVIPINDKRSKLQRIKESAALAWDAAIIAMREFEMDQLNRSVEHES